MTYEDGGSMTGYDLNLTFKEIEPIYNTADDHLSTPSQHGLLIQMAKAYFRNVPDFNYVSRLDGQKNISEYTMKSKESLQTSKDKR